MAGFVVVSVSIIRQDLVSNTIIRLSGQRLSL